MHEFKKIKTFACAIAVVGLAALVAGPAMAAERYKSAAAISGLSSIGAIGHNADDPQSADASTSDTGWQPILTANIKTQNHAELAFDMALQCGLITDTTVRSKGGDKNSATAEGSIRVRIQVTYEDGTVVYAAPSEEGDDNLGVTYCSRVQTLEAKFAGLNCSADLLTGAITCEDPEELRLLLNTLNANAFNYILTGVPVGTHTVEVQARAQANAYTFGTQLGEASAEALIGLGSVFIDEVQLINGYAF